MSEKSLPKYKQLKQEIISWIDSGKLIPNEQMPSENELANQFSLSRHTVRQTLGELETEGRLYRLQGKGTFVAEWSEPPSSREVQTIGIVTTYISDYIFPHLVRGAETVLRNRGYRLLLSSTDNDKARERESLEMMMSQPLSGLIVEPTRSAEGNPNLEYFLSLEYKHIPYLMINERYAEMTCPCVKMDDELGGYRATEHLMERGHRRVAGFFKTDDLQGVNRLKGFMRAHRERGLALAPELVLHYATEEKGEKPFARALQLLALPLEERPTAFVCYNDELAVHLLDAVRTSGLSVPGDLSIVSFDDSSLATATEVKLTTLSHPKAELGAAAADILIRMIEANQRDPRKSISDGSGGSGDSDGSGNGDGSDGIDGSGGDSSGSSGNGDSDGSGSGSGSDGSGDDGSGISGGDGSIGRGTGDSASSGHIEKVVTSDLVFVPELVIRESTRHI